MNPYGLPEPYSQGYIGPSHLQGQQNGPMNQVYNRLQFSKTTRTVILPVVACMFIQAVASFYFICTLLTFQNVVTNARDFSDDTGKDWYNIQIVFNVFTAVSSAMCAPMIKNSGYTITVIVGSVLFIFSTMSSSLVSSADILIIPYSVFGACAYGLLKVGPEVAMLDYLNNRRGLATGLSYLGITVGQLAGILSFIFTDMIEYSMDDGRDPKWPNNLRIIEVTVVIALMGAAVLQKPSFAIGEFPELFRFKPFYAVCFLQFILNMGFTLMTSVIPNVPEDREFTSSLSASPLLTPTYMTALAELAAVLIILVMLKCCCGTSCKRYSLLITGLAAAVLAAASFVNDLIYEDFWPLAFYAMGGGVVRAICRVTLPVALITYVGRANNKLALPFVEVAGGLGNLVAVLLVAEISSDDFDLEAQWYACASLLAVACLLAIVSYCQLPSWERRCAGQDEGELARLRVFENAAFDPEEMGT